jgi:hypothetical protein
VLTQTIRLATNCPPNVATGKPIPEVKTSDPLRYSEIPERLVTNRHEADDIRGIPRLIQAHQSASK